MLRNATFACVNECGETRLSLDTYGAHLNDHCEQRWIQCDQCSEKVRFCELGDHKAEQCQRIPEAQEEDDDDVDEEARGS